MPSNVMFDNPPVLQGDERTQLMQLKNYLFTMSNKLNEALMSISVEEISARAAEQLRSGKGANESAEEKQNAYQTLRSMIIKTATIVQNEMDVISTQLNESMTAISEEYGTLEERITNQITATAQGITQAYQAEDVIIRDNQTAFKQQIEGYVFTGILDPITGKVGIAIGEGVTAYDANGNAYLNDNAKVATFTSDRLSFYQGSVELAYFSSGKFYITNGEITNSLQIGNFAWKKMTDGSLALVKT